jgi:pyridoxamine 5'-phosphate oxidase
MEAHIDDDPVGMFSVWIEDALNSFNAYPNAMILSTVSSDHRPSSRIVLLKDFSGKGFDFFTSYKSKKAHQIEQNQFASLLFFWPELERQVRVEGRIEKISSKESDEYFKNRPRESQVSAWASSQSSVVASREELERRYQKMDTMFVDIPRRPVSWGGYRLVPDLFEFWQGREYRLHDRIEYIKDDKDWEIHRLAP